MALFSDKLEVDESHLGRSVQCNASSLQGSAEVARM